MLFYTHLLLGVVFFLLARGFFPVFNTPLFFVTMLLGSLLPDIDERHSKINRWSGFIGKIIAFLSTHRGFFHSLLFIGIVFGVLVYVKLAFYGWALLLGFLAHLLGDGLTPMGVTIFYPFSAWRIKGPFRTGGAGEIAVMVLLVVVIVRLVW